MVKDLSQPMESIRTVLELLLRQLPPESADEAALLAWSIVAGPGILARTRAERLEGGILHVRVCDATWLRQLEAVRGDLVQALNRLLGGQKIRDLALYVAPLTESQPASLEKP